MGIYRQSTAEELRAMRARLLASLHERLTEATSAGHNGRSAAFNQRPEDIRREIAEIDLELTRRTDGAGRHPIYLV